MPMCEVAAECFASGFEPSVRQIDHPLVIKGASNRSTDSSSSAGSLLSQMI